MPDNSTLTSAPHQAVRSYSLATLRSLVATWRQRIGFRRKLEEMAKTNPHIIDDIGLKRWQVEAEIAKPFWEP